MERVLNLNAVQYAKNGELLFDEEVKTDRSKAIANYNYTTSVRYLNHDFIKELARVHDACEGYGKYDENDNFIANYNEIITDKDEELANLTQTEGQIPVICLMEDVGEPDQDFIVIYNYEGVMRMTGIHADSHCSCYIYKVNQT
tara:strand:- start:58 stop:489 length:432 start_codon:yes stop_codon:yes gene_type:complete